MSAPAPSAASSSASSPAAPSFARSRLLVPLLGVAVLVLGAALAWVLMVQRASADGARPPAPAPVFLPLETLVVNLSGADDAFAGEHMAQVGITLELADERAARRIKPYLPGIRSSVLMLVSQRSARELLGREGKEHLARDMLQETLHFLDGNFDAAGQPPVRRVLFSSLIIQ